MRYPFGSLQNRTHSHVQVHYFVGFDPEKNMYHTIAINLFEFHEIDALPTALKRLTAFLHQTNFHSF